MVSEEVTADDIAEVISSWTGIPAGRMMQGESEKLLEMEKRIGARLIGQEDAVVAVADAVRRARASPTRTARLVPSCSWARPVSVRPSWLRHWLSSSSMTSAPWCVST